MLLNESTGRRRPCTRRREGCPARTVCQMSSLDPVHSRQVAREASHHTDSLPIDKGPVPFIRGQSVQFVRPLVPLVLFLRLLNRSCHPNRRQPGRTSCAHFIPSIGNGHCKRTAIINETRCLRVKLEPKQTHNTHKNGQLELGRRASLDSSHFICTLQMDCATSDTTSAKLSTAANPPPPSRVSSVCNLYLYFVIIITFCCSKNLQV